MFEKFTQDARNIVVLAQRESRELSHSYIGSEHLLLALVLDLGVVGRAFADLNITYAAVNNKIIEIIGRGNVTPAGHSPFTPRASSILRLANEISEQSGHGHIGPEHLVFALLEAKDSVGAQALVALGAKPSAVRRLVSASFARSYTGGQIFQGFTAAAVGGPYDTNPLRDTAEEAAADATVGQEVREIRFGLERSEYFIAVNGGGLPVEEVGRHLDYNRARTAAENAGAHVHFVVPQVKAVTAQTAAGIEVALAETIVWEPVRFDTRVEVLS
ncbi:Clp protease N-terminal domain-containing protein [Arthrobacter sp. UYCo732]|uniref:Clp protease N-terminal domain-containing protein n=1 Tax=Arthrobacter sp. UYCo732 TaxID=3156336 RepID=UPI0033974F54